MKCAKFILFLAVLPVLLLSCATGPSRFRVAPDWVYDPPEDTEEAVYFIGSGSDTSGNLSAAEEKAQLALTTEVTQFIGVKVTSETTIEARETLDSYEAEIRESIVQESETRMRDFRIVDKWVDERESDVVLVYLLGEYRKDSLLEEKDRIRRVFEEQKEAVSGPESEGDRLLDNEEYYLAALQYLDAAAAALSGNVDNREIKFTRNMKKARDAVIPIQLIKLNDNLDTITGKPFSDGFSVSVNPVCESVIGVAVKEQDSRGKPKVTTASIAPDSAGLGLFRPDVPQDAGSGSITMFLDFRSHLEALEDVPDRMRGELDSFELLAAQKKVTFTFRVYSMAKDIPTGVMILDVDMAGNLRDSADTESGIIESLTEAEYTVVPLSDRLQINRMDDGEIIAKAKLLYSESMDRIIFGVIRIADFDEDEGSYLVKVEGTVKAADLATGRILISESSSKWSRGSNTVSVISAAFKSIGQELGRGLASRMK